MKFSDMSIKEGLKIALEKQGFQAPTEVQEKSIPLALEGKDLVVQSKTGSGKTIAFVVPILCKIRDERAPQALILTPTRELAQQIFKEIRKLDSVTRSTVLYGGVSLGPQAEMLQNGAQVVVGTPGRVLDHLTRGTLSLKKVSFFVLDEADKMLDMGFIEDVQKIMSQVPSQRQTWLFSATMPDVIMKLSKQYMRAPEQVLLSKDEIMVDKIKQQWLGVNKEDKLQALMDVLQGKTVTKAIIFCNTKRWAETLGRLLFKRGFRNAVIHSGLSQHNRTRIIDGFKQGNSELLIATDVASRGLHIDHVSHVINYDVPRNPKDYVHRIGRTGRAGQSGDAINLVTPIDEPLVRGIEHEIQQYIKVEQSAKFSSTTPKQRVSTDIANAWDRFD